MKKFVVALSALLLLGAAAVFAAQGVHGRDGRGFHKRGEMGRHGGHMGMVHHIVKALDLTESQKTAARQLHEEAAEKVKPLREQHREQMAEVHELLDTASPDPTVVGQKLIAAHSTRDQIKAVHEETMARFSTLLNAEQKAKLAELHERHEERRFGFDHDGPGF
jgi:Spy/CpxP family protein refolding chaperone